MIRISRALPFFGLAVFFCILSCCLSGTFPLLSGTDSGEEGWFPAGGFFSDGGSWWEDGSDGADSWDWGGDDSGSWDWGGDDSGSWDWGGDDGGSWDWGGDDGGSWGGDFGGSDSGSW